MEEQKRGFGNFALIFVINLMVAVSFHILNPTLPKYVVSLGMTTGMAGLVSTFFVISSLIVRPFSGRMMTQCSLKRLLTFGLVCLLVSEAGYGLSGNVSMLLVFRLIHGFAWGITTTATATIAAQTLPEDKMASGIGIFGLGSCISNAISPNLGLWLIEGGSFTPLFVTAAMMPLLALVLTQFLRLSPVARKAAASGKQPFRLMDFFSAKCLIPMVMVLMMSVSVASVSNFLALYAEDIQVQSIGLFFTVYAVALFFSKPMGGTAADKLGFSTVIYGCGALMFAAFVLIATARSLPVFLIAAVLYGMGYGGLQPILQAWCYKRETPERRGVASSTFFIGLDAGTGIGATVAGLVAQYLSYRQMYAFMLLPIACSMLIYLINSRRERKQSG